MGRKLEFDASRALHRAMKVFWRKGYDATSMQDLVDAMKINRFSVYNTLGDKKSVYIKALEHYRTSVLAALLAPLNSEEPAKIRLDRYIQHMGEQLLTDSGALGCMIQNTSLTPQASDHDIQAALKDLYDDRESSIRRCVSDAMEKGEIVSKKTEDELVWFVLTHLQGLIILRKTTNDLVAIDGQIQMLRELVAHW